MQTMSTVSTHLVRGADRLSFNLQTAAVLRKLMRERSVSFASVARALRSRRTAALLLAGIRVIYVDDVFRLAPSFSMDSSELVERLPR
jgi:antitoxin component HigA of HigAB toxin-antitoxin module